MVFGLRLEWWVDGEECILGWVVLGVRVIGMKKEDLFGELKIILYDWWVGVKGWS